MKRIDKYWVLFLLCTLSTFIPPRAEGADTSAEAEKARQEFVSRCPMPEWWDRMAVPDVRINTYDDLLDYWQNKERTKSEFFKAAYQAILDYPLDADIVATAVKLMNYTASYGHRMELQEYGAEKYFSYNSVYGKAGDTTAGIVENLAGHYNDTSQYDRTVSLIERLIDNRGHEINDHLLELIHVQYAEALHGQDRTDRAISVLHDAIAKYNGSWEKQLKSEASRYERILQNAASVKTTPLIDRPDTFQPWWKNNSQAVYAGLIIFFLLFIIKNIIKNRTDQKPSRRY